MEGIMKSCKCLMGAMLSTVLLISSVFAGNALSQEVKDGLVGKSQLTVVEKKINIHTRPVRMESSGIEFRDCTDCEFDFTNYGSECCDSAWDEYGIDCATLESNYSWDCSGCTCPGDVPCEDQGLITCEYGAVGGGNCAEDESGCLEAGECDAGFVPDCADDDCCPESWIGDGFEDCEDQAYGCDLTCYDNDGGDCAGGTDGGTDGGSSSCEDWKMACPAGQMKNTKVINN